MRVKNWRGKVGLLKKPPRGSTVLVENRLRFSGQVDELSVQSALHERRNIKKLGLKDVVFDFSDAGQCHPVGMLGLISFASTLRKEGVWTTIAMPRVAHIHRLFLNSNWAHFIDPENHERYELQLDRHLTTQRYSDFGSQQKLVTRCMEIVSGQMELERDVLDGLEWSVNEITDNVLNHSKHEEGGWLQVVTFKEAGVVEFVVADAGQGIPGSMRRRFPELRDDVRAIEEAVKAGVTSNPEAGQGNGLTGSLRVATLSGGLFQVISGAGRIRVDGRGPRNISFRPDAEFMGTVVSVRISKHRKFTMAEALGFAGVNGVAADFIDLLHEDESGNNLVLRISDEANGFRSRGAGAFVRTKCVNFLRAAPDKNLIVDWKGVSLVSSSFADEAMGKLFVEFGPIVFGARVRHRGMEGLVRNIVDKAILQRAAQHIGKSSAAQVVDGGGSPKRRVFRRKRRHQTKGEGEG